MRSMHGGNGGAVESVESQKQASPSFHEPLGNPATGRRDSHIPTVPATKADGKVENQNQVFHFPTATIPSFPPQHINGGRGFAAPIRRALARCCAHRQDNERRLSAATPTGSNHLPTSGSSPIGIDLPFQAHLALESIPDFRLTSGLENAELEKAEAAAMKATSITLPSSHVPMLSHPKEVADLIAQAAAKAGSR